MKIKGIRVRRWFNSKRREVWSEPGLPDFVKINPNSPPGAAAGLQPGDVTMAAAAEEFLEADDSESTLSRLTAGDRRSAEAAVHAAHG